MAFSPLSAAAAAQLGTPGFPTRAEWAAIRPRLFARAAALQPGLRSEMAAYTPGETLGLLDRPEAAAWRKALGGMGGRRGTRLVVLVPCAKTKPWADAPRGLYRAYNRIRADRPEGVFFATVSEPLGIVPKTRWADFPAYDNPGLFSCTVMRSGLFTRDWAAVMGMTRRPAPRRWRAWARRSAPGSARRDAPSWHSSTTGRRGRRGRARTGS